MDLQMASFQVEVVRILPVVVEAVEEDLPATMEVQGMGNENLVGKTLEEDASMEHLVVGEVMLVAGDEDRREGIEDRSVEIVNVVEVEVDSSFGACFAYWLPCRLGLVVVAGDP